MRLMLEDPGDKFLTKFASRCPNMEPLPLAMRRSLMTKTLDILYLGNFGRLERAIMSFPFPFDD